MPEDNHVHELAISEEPATEGIWYCTICNLNYDELPDDDEITIK